MEVDSNVTLLKELVVLQNWIYIKGMNFFYG